MKTIYFFFVVLLFFSCQHKSDGSNNDTSEKDGPVLYVAKDHLDLGKIIQGDIVKAHFKLQNKGTKDLFIHYVSASCGCTATHWETKPIKPGEKSEIEITFNSSGRKGRQNKEVYVSSNTSEKEEVLKFTCEVVLPNKSDK